MPKEIRKIISNDFLEETQINSLNNIPKTMPQKFPKTNIKGIAGGIPKSKCKNEWWRGVFTETPEKFPNQLLNNFPKQMPE